MPGQPAMRFIPMTCTSYRTTYAVDDNRNALDYELRYRRADGVYRWFQVRILPMRDTDGRITGWSALLTDIEDRKRAEEALRESETDLRQIVDGIPGLVCTLNSAKIDMANRKALDFFGHDDRGIQGLGEPNGTVHPDDLPGVIDAYSRAISSGTALLSSRIRIEASGRCLSLVPG